MKDLNQYKMIKISLILLSFIFFSCSSTELINLDLAKGYVKEYYEEGQYDKEMNEIIDNTIDELKGNNYDSTAVVIFDVDETMLSNYEHTKELGYGFVWELWHKWMLQADAPIIPQTKRLYDWLIENNIHVIFITGRSEDVHKATLKNLYDNGVTSFDTLITREGKEENMSANTYKEIERELLAKKGYNIIACIGDQWSDLRGKYTGLKVKLPNYLYLIE